MSNMLRRAAKKSTLSLRNLASKMEPKDKGKAKEKAIEPLQEQKKPQGNTTVAGPSKAMRPRLSDAARQAVAPWEFDPRTMALEEEK
ncbi:hypothetical protein UCRPA7_5600 [Phaeoacremonium minimum UCRPA7]|uniref:Uncharacterized protein n=1 Tax=Phaeoacremonium minimum (strain UCR-PA7) TaxID=1286976 RepID=R8BHZ4_PHAM7|nr:hypothetical protein UCRPA7_5600 [Phaeoacremonium minimum UCRPA7]EON98889.1 hypothetical protein UCRPA7_5600 [Phaeoacremonium minimum UCRPA7]